MSLYTIFYSDCNDVFIGAAENISKRCSKYATVKNCKNNGYVRKRCQLACGVCEGSKYDYSTPSYIDDNCLRIRRSISYSTILIHISISRSDVTICNYTSTNGSANY